MGSGKRKATRLFADVWKALFCIPHGEALHIHAQYSILAEAHAEFVESPYTKPFTNARHDLHAYDHTTLKAPHPVRSAQLNNVRPHQYLGKVSAKICILSVALVDVGLREDLHEADSLPWGAVSAKAARLFADVWKALFRIPHGEALHIHAQCSILAEAHAEFVESPYTKPFTNA
ncbi:hypothetical protein M513_13887 [Trichuris suis]|uniref:Uncharacterized protein n=1 Tax=Trichuris suis TaxID=68888 RepID=A0A085LJT8_9BILA|nr:hypothetical protein M513_13887 [Trichuris suis]